MFRGLGLCNHFLELFSLLHITSGDTLHKDRILLDNDPITFGIVQEQTLLRVRRQLILLMGADTDIQCSHAQIIRFLFGHGITSIIIM